MQGKGYGITDKGEIQSDGNEIIDFDGEVSNNKDPNETSFQRKVIKTMVLVCVWISMGLCGEVTGPTLLDLKLRTHSNYESVSFGVSGPSAGSFVGSVMGGLLVDKFGSYCDSMMAFALDGLAVTTVTIPWVTTTNLLFVMTMLQGTMLGVLNIVGQKLILDIWKEKAASPLHLLHGGYGVGSFIIPLVANPFLAVTKKLSGNSSVLDNITHLPGVTVESITRTATTTEIVIKESKMEFAYFIAAAIAVGVSLAFYGYHFAGRKARVLQSQNTGKDKHDSRKISFKEMFNPATCAGGDLMFGVFIFVFLFMFYMQIAGCEMIGGKFIRTYAIKALNFSDDDGSYINTVYWIAFSVGRFLGLLTARFIPIRLLIMLETGVWLLTAILLVIFGDSSVKALWVLMPALGFTVGPLYPSGVGWANYHLEMTGVAITFILLGQCASGLVYLRLTGYLFDRYGYKSFLYIILGLATSGFGITCLVNILGTRHGSRFDIEKQKSDDKMNPKEERCDVNFDNKGYDKE